MVLFRMKKVIYMLLGVQSFLVCADTPSIYQNRTGSIRDYGDIAEFALPVSAFSYSLLRGDTQGAWQMTEVALSTALVVEGVKRTAKRRRPDGGKSESFPSGHTSSAFTGAAYINHRYGLLPSLPLYAAAATVGYSRVWANRHFVDDVLAGASIAVLSSLYWTSPFQAQGVTLRPSYNGDGVGVDVTLDESKSSEYSPDLERLNHRFEFDLGIGSTVRNTLRQEQGRLIDFDALGDTKDANFSSLQWHFERNKKSSYLLHITPFESRFTDRSNDAITLNGQTFAANVDIVSAYRYWVFGGSWYYNIGRNIDRYGIGVDLSWYHFSNRLESVDGAQRTEVNKNRWLPGITAYYSRPITSHLQLDLETRYAHLSEHKSWWLSGEFIYRFNSHWDLGLGYSRYENRVYTDSFDSESQYNMYTLQVGYSFDI